MKKILAVLLSLAAAFQIMAAIPALPALAADDGTLTPDFRGDSDPSKLLEGTKLGGSTSEAASSLPLIIGNIVKAGLGMLGIIFVCLMLYSGFMWMTAAGDEGKVEKAKSTIQRAVIGMLIIIAAYAITSFVITSIQNAAAAK